MKRNIKKTIQSVDRALMILEQFSTTEKEIGLAELSKRLGLKRTTCYGLAETLLAHGYLAFNEDTVCYRLGIKVFQIGQIYAKSIEIHEIARPLIMRLSENFEQTVHLVIRDGVDAVYVDKVGERESFRIRSRVGTRAERFCAAVSEIVLAHLDEDQLPDLLAEPLKKFTNNTITDPEKFLQNLAIVRKNGYAIDNERLETGLICIAAPIYNHRRQLVAAVSMSGRSEFMTERQKTVIAGVKECAEEITAQLGG